MPLAGRRFVVAGSGPIADECASLLEALAADVVRVVRVTPRLAQVGAEGAIDATATLAAGAPPFPVVRVDDDFDGDRAWAASGAMGLTGTADGPPLLLPTPMLPARLAAVGALIQLLAASTFGTSVELDPLALLGERAAFTGQTRHGSVSVGGACEMVRAADGWIALNLPRPDDVALLPAWLEGAIEDGADAVGMARAVAARPTAALVEQGAVLGLALSAWPPLRHAVSSPYVIDGTTRAAGRLRSHTPAAPSTPPGRPPLVVDMSSLWAGPLAGGLLAQAGAVVVKVEGARRPDGARRGPAAFFDLLNAGKRCIALDFDDEHDVRALADLMTRASLVIEGSRRRVMDRLGIDVATTVAGGTSWLSITAYGRDGDGANRVGFGDDVAVAGGLAIDGEPPLFVGDAIADPITGLYAALAGLACLGSMNARFVDASLYRATCYAAGAPATARGERTVLLTDHVAAPRARPARGVAEPHGASTDDVLRKFALDASRAEGAKMRAPRSLEGDL